MNKDKSQEACDIFGGVQGFGKYCDFFFFFSVFIPNRFPKSLSLKLVDNLLTSQILVIKSEDSVLEIENITHEALIKGRQKIIKIAIKIQSK